MAEKQSGIRMCSPWDGGERFTIMTARNGQR